MAPETGRGLHDLAVLRAPSMRPGQDGPGNQALRSLRTDWIIFLTCERWVLRFQISMISPCDARHEST